MRPDTFCLCKKPDRDENVLAALRTMMNFKMLIRDEGDEFEIFRGFADNRYFVSVRRRNTLRALGFWLGQGIPAARSTRCDRARSLPGQNPHREAYALELGSHRMTLSSRSDFLPTR